MKQISILGLGYVGLPTAAVFADVGMKVVGVDINAKSVETINSGRAHIVEPGLDELLTKVVGNGSLRATTTAEPSDVFVIAVPTPFKEGNAPDLAYIKSAAGMIAPLIKKGNLVILESTSPVGATEQLAGWIQEARPDLKVPKLDGEEGDIYLAYCPERILPGKVIQEVIENDRVIGGVTAESSSAAVAFYKNAVKGTCHTTNARTAELCKLSENSFRDVNIAFANELSMISAKLGIDVYELIALTNRHPRVEILQPGTGVGGHCIAVDPWFIVDSAPKEARIIRTAREVNDSKPRWVVDQIIKLAEDMVQPVIACMGLAYKPDVDDLRESPAVQAVKVLVDQAIGKIVVCEPFVDALPASLDQLGLTLMNANQACDEADIIVFLTAHGQFRSISAHQLKSKIVFDACGLTK
ncbi:UDP-N-acetyl-D-mannosamine dehydrogenase [Parasphingorhabdus flavimaris]|uniref:UDP-N-acetyl-D-mannosamine dehydrogenase n=1 Tax=Parasphingorhabdus flavimaris TaxID=266812 RepID=UPI00300156D8